MAERNESDILYNFSHHLMNTGPIVETILKFLNAKDLNRCSTVCQSWYKIIKKLKSRRRTRSWTCLKLSDGTEDTGITQIVEDTKHFLQNLFTEPDIVFMMCDSDLLSTTVSSPTLPTNRRRRHLACQNYQGLVRSLLPRSCKLIGLGASGIVGTSEDCKESHELENESQGVAFLCLPKYAGVDISLNADLDEGDDSGANIRQFYDGLSRRSCRVILMLISDFHAPRKHGNDLMKKMTESVIAGAFVEDITPLVSDSYSFIRLASISGDNVQVASIVIGDSIQTEKDAEDCVKKLKQYNLPEENSFALMFACLGRGEGLYGEPNVEASLFRKHFPWTPLIGLFGNGEIGFEMVNQGLIQSETKKSHKTLYHSFTTILVLVSIVT